MKIVLLTVATLSLSLLISCDSNSSKINNTENIDTNIRSSRKTSFSTETMDKETIKKLFGFKGEIEDFICWSDNEGKHIIFTNETGIFHTNIREKDGLYDQNAEVSCFHYLQKNGETDFEKVWKIYDYSRDCPVDAGASFKKNTLQQTDLNNNGVAEIWTMYYTYCKGDISPSELKIIMYEGDQKYKMTGETRVNVGNDDFYGGSISSEGNFKGQPEFLKFARSLWKNNCTETFGE